ncbi:MAG TPA: L-threonylcarbamoyladenylate synthase [Patescibacteria group bacterium]|nr:L-threonylcarbamoyladenylate synthase [Patescibacteria group bacterium]
MQIVSYKESKENKIIQSVCDVLSQGGLVIIPSDTVYALVVDATNQSAVNTLLDFKKRPHGKAISIFVENVSKACAFVSINKKQMNTVSQLIPGPFTVVLSYKGGLMHGLASEENTLGIRVPDYPFIKNLLVQYGAPLTATSANISGRSPHYSIQSFMNALPDKKKQYIGLIVDRGRLPHNKPSTVVDLTGDNVRVLRQGDYQIDRKNFFYVSHTSEETGKIGSLLLQKYLKKAENKPLIFLIEGELGTGKTVFVKGVGIALGVRGIVSPTFVIYYEYPVPKNNIKKLYHFDLYAIENEEEFRYLKIDDMLKPKNVICIEWGEKSMALLDQFKKKGFIIYIRIEYKSSTHRTIQSTLFNHEKS